MFDVLPGRSGLPVSERREAASGARSWPKSVARSCRRRHEIRWRVANSTLRRVTSTARSLSLADETHHLMHVLRMTRAILLRL